MNVYCRDGDGVIVYMVGGVFEIEHMSYEQFEINIGFSVDTILVNAIGDQIDSDLGGRIESAMWYGHMDILQELLEALHKY